LRWTAAGKHIVALVFSSHVLGSPTMEGMIMPLRVHHRRPLLLRSLLVCSILSAALWLLSIWITVRVGLGSVHVSLHRGMVRISTNNVALYEHQFHDNWLSCHFTPIECPASFGLHWPYRDGTITGFQVGVPLFAIWAPGAVLVGVLLRRRPPPGCCTCGYDLTGNVTGRCPECGSALPSQE
jgi:hypothetical protein